MTVITDHFHSRDERIDGNFTFVSQVLLGASGCPVNKSDDLSTSTLINRAEVHELQEPLDLAR